MQIIATILSIPFMAPPILGFEISGHSLVVNPGLSPGGIRNPNRPNELLTRLPEEDVRTHLTSTPAGGDLLARCSESLGLSSVERMAMACYGNLGVVFSSYYLQPVEVEIETFGKAPTYECDFSESPRPLSLWDRVVNVMIGDRRFCKATCKVRVYSEEIQQTMTEQDFTIGNLLRTEGLQPKFRLHQAGRSSDGGLWRYYTMDCPGQLELDILEEFSRDAFTFDCTPKFA
jgi:hypothetical protein